MQMYARLCRTVNSTGQLIPLEEIENVDNLYNIVSKNIHHDWYRSAFYYGPDAKDYFEKNNKSIKDYPGVGYSKRLIFDFDSSTDLSISKKDAETLLFRLSEEGVDIEASVGIFYSGRKGFHVEVSIPAEITNTQSKTICSNLAAGLKTFDVKMYNVTRLYRLANTKHAETGLYKIQLSYSEFKNLTAELIKVKAAVKRDLLPTVPITNVDLLEKYSTKPKGNSSQSVVIEDDGLGGDIRGLDRIDFSKCPKFVPRCIYALQQGVMKPGERNEAFFRLATYNRNQGMDKRVTHRLLKGVAELNHELYPEADLITRDEIWNTVISSAYGDGKWKVMPGATGASKDNELIKRYCDAIRSDHTCILHGTKDASASVFKIEDVSSSFESYATDLDNNTVLTGINFIDDNMKITVGTTTLLVGATGCGKTTLALNILENANKAGQHCMFFSLDMHKNLVFLKLAQKLTNYTQAEILYFYKNKQIEKINEIKDLIAKTYDKTFFDFSSSITMEEMKARVLSTEEKSGHKIRLVIVDYASRVSSQFSDTYSNANHNALKSTGVAADTNAAWLYICQISRNSGDGNTPLRSKRVAKESGSWEESSTNLITVWRPFMGKPEYDDCMRMYLAKNRMGKEIEEILHWNGAKGTITDVTAEDKAWYEQERLPIEKEMLKSKFGAK